MLSALQRGQMNGVRAAAGLLLWVPHTLPSISSSALQVTVLFAGQHISKSPFEVEIGMAQGDSSKATAQGPGLEPSGNIANKATYFDVYTAGSADSIGSAHPPI